MHFHQAVLDNNLSEITVAYESGWNRLTEKYYAKTEWPEAEIIAPLVNDGKRYGINSPGVVTDDSFKIKYFLYSIASCITDTCTLAFNPTSMTVFTHTRTAASYSTISLVSSRPIVRLH